MADIDVSPGILEQMNQAIEANDASKRARNRLIVKAEKGQAVYKDAYDYAGLCGKAAADAIREIEESDLPNGRMYFNIADKTIRPVLEETSDEIFSYASQLLENVNEKAGIHLKPVLPDPEETAEKIKGVLDLASSNEHWNEVREETAQTVENFSRKCVDDHIQTNAERQYEAGLSAKVVRTASRGACEWCEDVAGSYEYAAVKGRGEDVWRRHANCDCVIEYEPVKGKRQTVSSGSYRQNKDSLSPQEREKNIEEIHSGSKGLGSGEGSAFIPPHDPPVRIGKVTNNEEYEIALKEFKERVTDAPIEHALVIEADGTITECFGIETRVWPDADLGTKRIENAIVSHNHIPEYTTYSFGADDFKFFRDNPIIEMYGFDDKYEYCLTRLSREIDLQPENWRSLENYQHSQIINFAQQSGFGYTRRLR